MGRPLRKQNFGNTDLAGPQLIVSADIGGEGAEDCWIVDQPGSRTYTVSSLAGGTFPSRTGRVKLQQGTIVAEGQARLSVTPFDGVSNVTALGTVTGLEGSTITENNITITNGGSGYSVPPTVTIVGDGSSSPTATATLTNGVVTAVTVTGGSSDHTSGTITFSDPAAGGTVEYARTLQQHTVKTWEGNAYTWKLGVTASVTGAATLPSA